MNWHEDFEDEPAVEDRMPYGLSPEEMSLLIIEAPLGVCEFCGVKGPREDFVKTGLDEYLTMDLDPNTLACPNCLEDHRLRWIVDDPSLFDCFTAVQFVN
jgi:hypothetical protein